MISLFPQSTNRGGKKRFSDEESENLKSIGLKMIDDNFKVGEN